MNVFWRFLWIILFSRFSPSADLFKENATSFRVLPTDIDVLMHMNNGRYFSLMDLARIDFMIRCHVFPTLKKNKVYPVVASEMMRFKKSLPLFKRFDIITQLMGWDDKFFYVVHYFKSQNEIYALGIIKARFLRSVGGPVNPTELLDLIGIHRESPSLPIWVIDWQKADQAFYDNSLS